MGKKKTTTRSMQRIVASPRSPRGAVTADRIVATAVRLIDKTGLEHFTVRQISDELGCVPTAIYWHFRNKNALLKAVLGAASSLQWVSEATVPWEERTRVICRSLRNNLRQRPYILALTHLFPGSAVGPISKAFTEIACEAGYAGAEAAAVARLLVKLTVGFSAQEQEDDANELLKRRDYRAELLDQATSMEDVELFMQYAAVNQREIFEAALEFVLQALRRRAPVLKALTHALR
jgi:AcrR family transcriptional regulator